MLEQEVDGADEPILTIGRDESTRRQWTQASVLGVLIALFFAPAFGFPMMSGGGRFERFFLAILVFALGCVIAVRMLRRNRAVRIGTNRVEWVDGARRGAIAVEDLRGARYDPRTRVLELAGKEAPIRMRLPPAWGVAAVRGVEEALSQRAKRTTELKRSRSV